MNYNFVNSWGVACDLAKAWMAQGYASIWVRSDGKVIPSRGMVGNDDDVRRYGSLSARRVALTNKRESGRAIVTAIRAGIEIPDLCRPGRLTLTPSPALPLLRGGSQEGDLPATISAPGRTASDPNNGVSAGHLRPAPFRPSAPTMGNAAKRVEVVAIPVYGEYACPVCGDPTSFCDCDSMPAIGRRAA